MKKLLILSVILSIWSCSTEPEAKDCAGVEGGSATIDDCGVCAGDNSSCSDCAGLPNGNTVVDECNICGGDNSTCADCGGIPYGDNLIDNCGTCDNDSTNDCAQDCAGSWGGGLIVDECGICGGDNSSCSDCAGIPNGSAYEDECGTCDSNLSNDCPLSDIDGNEYTYIKIGNQIWMQQNLMVTHYQNGDELITEPDSDSWDILILGAYIGYQDNYDEVDIFGYLYNWYAVDDDRGVCPEGWHVPEKDEWIYLTDYLHYNKYPNTSYSGSMKECRDGDCPSSDYWWDPNYGATNESGFTALPGGYRRDSSGPDFDHIGGAGYFWSSTEDEYERAWQQQLNFNYVSFPQLNSKGKKAGMSIRCLKD